jgi:hypothetical protein
VKEDRRGLRFAFSAGAELAPESSPTAFVPARVTELSLQGCFLETSASFEIQRPVVVKIYDSGEYFETKASVLYVKPTGMGLVFRDIKPHFRAVLQKWILTALNNQPDARPTPG